MKIALLCSGLGHVYRGHEVFARDLFDLIGDAVDITLFKGGGQGNSRERVIDHIPRGASYLEHIHVAVSPKWEEAVKEEERIRIEDETFAYAALKPLLEGEFDIIHCLEQDVCNIIYTHRHLFRQTPKIVFSNGGAIPARDLPRCDFVQEYTEHNLEYSAKNKAFMIPHGVDLNRFNPKVESDFRAQHGIPKDAFVVISVGTICYWHKRMDYVIRESAALKNVYLLIVGQESRDTPAIKELGKRLMGDRISFTTLPHDELPKAYAAADVFVLGSLFETFGIVYIEAMAMGLPIICTNHVNQRSIVKEGLFIDMRKPGALTQALRDTDRATLAALGKRGLETVRKHYDIEMLKQQYIERYQLVALAKANLPKYNLMKRLASNTNNVMKQAMRLIYGRSE
ncbi:MAG: glycosyltransferase family 4 protein [Candidatus Competibacteraceae bacterium]